MVEGLATKLPLDPPIQSLEGKVSELEVFPQDVQHANHLRKNEDSVLRLPEPHQELVQQQQLSTAFPQLLQTSEIDRMFDLFPIPIHHYFTNK